MLWQFEFEFGRFFKVWHRKPMDSEGVADNAQGAASDSPSVIRRSIPFSAES
jgi:hypothetical protein